MSASFYSIDSIKLLLQPAEKKSPFANRETKPFLATTTTARPARQSSMVAPEDRLWKLAHPPVSATLAIVEHASLLLFLAVAMVAMTACITECFHLLQTDAIRHIAARALSSAA